MYKILKKTKYFLDKIEFSEIREQNIEAIRKIRNSQIEILRQKKNISKKEQVKYFNKDIFSAYKLKKPKNILLGMTVSNIFVGYCGLTHIDWDVKKAEISFIVNNKINKNKKKLVFYFNNAIKILEKILFNELKFNKIFCETYSFRQEMIQALKDNDYVVEGILKDNIKIKKKYYDSIFTGKFKKIK